MATGESPGIFHLVLIAGRQQKDHILSALSKKGGHIINVIFGSGTIKATTLMEMLGLVQEREKVIITCLASNEEAGAILSMLTDDFGFDKPNTGIVYTIPVGKLSY